MDTKLLYIKTQKNLQNWGIVISSILFILSLFPFVLKNKGIEKNTIDVWVNLFCYSVIFGGFLYSRIRNNVKMSLLAFFTYLALFVYYLVAMTVKAKFNYANFKTLNMPNPLRIMILGYAATVFIMSAISYLYYKVFLAAKNVQILSQKYN